MNCPLPLSLEISPVAMLPCTKANDVGDPMFPVSELSYEALSAQQYRIDLDAITDDGCFFLQMGEVIRRRTHGLA